MDVPFAVAERMAEALEETGVECEFVSRTGWTHVFDQVGADRPDVQAALRRVLAFLDKHLK
jgi:dipeptidyl aminopeptidase/acylaminoacyl peptidase